MRAKSGLLERLSVCLCVCILVCVCVYVYVTFLLSTSKFKPFVWVQSRASARSKHSGGLNNSTFLLACTAQSPVRSNNKVELFGLIRRGFCDTIQESAQPTRLDNGAMCVLGLIPVGST